MIIQATAILLFMLSTYLVIQLHPSPIAISENCVTRLTFATPILYGLTTLVAMTEDNPTQLFCPSEFFRWHWGVRRGTLPQLTRFLARPTPDRTGDQILALCSRGFAESPPEQGHASQNEGEDGGIDFGARDHAAGGRRSTRSQGLEAGSKASYRPPYRQCPPTQWSAALASPATHRQIWRSTTVGPSGRARKNHCGSTLLVLATTA